jgi:hypothetical protein
MQPPVFSNNLNHIGSSMMQNRRTFLQNAVKASAGTSFFASGRRLLAAPLRRQKIVVVTFGGGARDEETFAPEGHGNIPNLMNSLLPRSTFFGRVTNGGILGHYVATASLATGVYESFNNFSSTHPVNPTIFEYYRKALARPAHDAWVVAPGDAFSRMASSSSSNFGPHYSAEVVVPKRLLRAVLSHGERESYSSFLQESYEEPDRYSSDAYDQESLEFIEQRLKINVAQFRQELTALKSPDEMAVHIAKRIMLEYTPSLLWITLHDMDIAHSGAYSLYLDAISRTDQLCMDLWSFVESHPDYNGNTTMLIMPDFGRDSDFTAGGNGFQHHRTGDAMSRTVWMMVLGNKAREGLFVQRPVDSLDLVPTVGGLLHVPTPLAKGNILRELLP